VKNFFLSLSILFLFLQGFLHSEQQSNLDVYVDPLYWKKQALEEIIPFWEKTVDKKDGGFFTDVSREGNIGLESGKYPRMISRAIFGFSVAYLLSGDEKYLEFARNGLEYLTNYGWDRENGGWYEYVTGDKKPKISYKNLFDETYGNLGTIMYYFTTHDKNALHFVEATHNLMQTKAWDNKFGGYYAYVNTDWGVASDQKSFNAEIDTCSAYLIYYYLATGNAKILKDLEHIVDVVVKYMVNPETGFVGEYFTRDWKSLDPWLWVGHNLKTGWVMMRTYWLTGDKKYSEIANKIAEAQLKYNWDSKYCGWYFQFRENDPGYNRDSKDWWTQTEGNFLMLNLYRMTTNSEYLERFKEGAYFWDKYIMDHQYKECYTTTTRRGSVADSRKAHLYKSAYHSMEHALFNYLYTGLYVNKGKVDLYFRLNSESDNEIHYVRIVEDPAVIIEGVEINGKPWNKFSAKEGYIILPKGQRIKTKVTFVVQE